MRACMCICVHINIACSVRTRVGMYLLMGKLHVAMGDICDRKQQAWRTCSSVTKIVTEGFIISKIVKAGIKNVETSPRNVSRSL